MKNLWFSIIILTYNRKEKLNKLLNSLKEQTYKNFEIIVVDNNSSDNTGEMVKIYYPEVKYIFIPENTGIRGFNEGVKHAFYNYLIFLDGDVIVEKNFVKKINKKFNCNSSNTLVVGRLLNYHTKKIAWDNTLHFKTGDYLNGFKAIIFNGSAFAVSKELWEKTGGTWKYETPYLWEKEFSIRILKKGGKIKYFPDIIVYHNTEENATDENILSKRKLLWYYDTIIAWKYLNFLKAIEKTIREGVSSFFALFTNKDYEKLKWWFKLLKEMSFILIKMERRPVRGYVKRLINCQKEMTNIF